MAVADLNAVAAFVKVVDMKSFRAAARELGLPKSTVSLRIVQLEERVGARLLERTTRSLRLTDPGSAYYRQVVPALEALREADRMVSDQQAEPSGSLRLTAPRELGQVVLGGIAAEYMTRHPAVKVEIEFTDRQVNLVEEGFDLALRPGPLPDSTLMSRKLGEPASLRCYASASYLRRRGHPREPQELRAHDCLTMSARRQPNLWQFRQGRKTISIEVRSRVAANSFVVLRDLAAAGQGITRLPFVIGTRAPAAGQLRPVLDAFAPEPVHYHALYSGGRIVPPKLRAFLELLEERFQESLERPWTASRRR